jgi:trehalose/maltose hydrolase-like predicted phosphorylase
VSLDRPHLACLRTTITAQNWSGTLHVRSLMDGRVRNDNVAEFDALAKHQLTEPASGDEGGTWWLVTETTQSRVRIALAAHTTLNHDCGAPVAADRRVVHGPGHIGHEWTAAVETGVPVTVDKTAAIFTSRDNAISEPLHAARVAVTDAPGFPALRAAHTLAWHTCSTTAATATGSAFRRPGAASTRSPKLRQHWRRRFAFTWPT